MEDNESINLAIVVGYCLSSLQEIAEQLSKGEANKAASKTYEAIKFIKDKTEKPTQPIHENADGTE